MRKRAMLLAPDTGAEAAGGEAHTIEQAQEITEAREMEQAKPEQEGAASEAAEQAQPEREGAASEVAEQAKPEREDAASEAAEQAQDERERTLAAREKEIERRELRAQALEKLAAQRLPALLAETLDYTNAQAMEDSLEAMREVWTQAVQKGIEERMKGAAPRTGGVAVRPGTLREAIEGRYAGV